MNCKNCQQELDKNDRYCHHCGARVITSDLTYRYLLQEMSERFFNFENNLILKTVRGLFTDPKDVIDGYINGVRKKYLAVFNYLALAITLSGLQVFLIKKLFSENLNFSVFVDENNPVAESMTAYLDNIFEYNSLIYISLIPIYAFIARLTFFNYKKYTYLHHLVIATYNQAHISIITFLPIIILLSFQVNYYELTYYITPFMILYNAYVYKKIYELSLLKIILKTLFFLLILGVFYIITVLGFIVLLVLTGAIEIPQ